MGKNGLLIKSSIFLLLLFLPGDTSPITEPQYLVLVPFLIHTESQEKVCVQLTECHTREAFKYGQLHRFLLTFQLPKSRVPLPVMFLTVTVTGATLQFSSRKLVAVQNSESLVFIQTDKPIYKPGQTVLFRIVSLDEEFRPVNEMVSIIIDPKKNRLYQWTNVELEMGFIQLLFNLTSEPIQGTYTVVAQKAAGKTVRHSFSVEEYVLPKFEVTVKMPKVISILDEELKVTVCGLYTFGKPVPGLVNFRVCRKYERAGISCYGEEARAVCEEFSGQVNIYGCISEVVKTKLFQLKRSGYENKLHVEAKIKEEDTGMDHLDERAMNFCLQFVHLCLRIYTCIVLLFQAVHKPNIFCYERSWVVPYYEEGYLQLKRFYSRSNSFLKIEPKSKPLICGSSTEIQVHYILTPEAVGDQKKITFYYLVMAKGNIKRGGTHILDLDQESDNGVFSLQLSVQADIAPVAQVLVYTTVPSREVIADSAKFNTELCFNNKVDLSFSPSEGLPSSDAHLQFRASPNSLCAVRAVDKSVLLMKPEADLSPASVSSWSVEWVGAWSEQEQPALGWKQGTVPLHDADISFACLELSVVDFFFISPHSDILAERASAQLSTPEEVTETVRKYFPETWIWSLVPISPEGKADLEVTIPDTITEWKANAFCTSADTGFGLSPTVSLRAFQPFFVELTMPYSVVRGESFTLKATVFNYLPACIRVSVTLAQSSHFLATLVEKEEESHCLCENVRKTVAWRVTPKSLGQVEFSVTTEALQSQQPCGNYIVETPEKGRKDTVIRQLLVEPEGVEKETTQNSVLCVKGKAHSLHALCLLLCGLMGGMLEACLYHIPCSTAMQNLHQLLQMPFGCGEQNMVLFAPNIYVLDYLNKTGQLNEEIKSKATGYLVSGYQRQLSYKHQDGSYSTFGQRYGQPGNTWLTAFVLKSFAQARHHIFIEEKHIHDALNWLSYKQKENGCFQSSGTLLNNAMKGGVDNEVTLTAYITIALLEIPLPVTYSVVRNALFCLETAASQEQNHVYTKALLAYAFALAGNREKRKALLDSLEKEAVRKGECSWWDMPFTSLTPSLAEMAFAGGAMAAGTGQCGLRYNVQPTQEKAPFQLRVYTIPEVCVDSKAHKVFDIGINVSYTGERNVSNMVIVDVKMLSGFVPLKSSVRKLEGHPVIERTELNTNHVLLYLEKVRMGLSFSFTVERDIPVRGLKPAQVKVYDYYETGECL
uniref:Alpha-2-macroglobulin-like n=1 Tax=Cyanistes caeruleus TaxID=156563 RepID=A0A8C0UN50_CYACU